MPKINALTPEQEALLPVYRDRWRAIGLQTGPADRPRAEAAVQWIYAQAGLSAPRIVWCGSPLGNGLTRWAVQKEIFSVGARD
jgi:hypothetical protein